MITVIQDTKHNANLEKGWWIIDAPGTPECYGYKFFSKMAAVAVAKEILAHPKIMNALLDFKLEMIPHHLVKVLNR